MSVRQNMEFALKPQKLAASEVAARIAEASRILGLEPLLERRPSQLSGGQRQRVAMGRAMVRTPRVFLFDEPLSNLDAKLRNQVRLEIAKLHKRLGTTIVYVTHDQIEAMTLADKVVIMKDGRIEQVGTPEEVFKTPRNLFVATFIGSPAMNLIAGTVRVSAKALALQAGTQEISLPLRMREALKDGQKATLGIRPTDIELVEQGSKGAHEARLEVTEYLGTEALLDLRLGDIELAALVPAAKRPKTDTTVWLSFNTDHLHVFDTATGNAI
jgi:multiple sugar transport system ATP-binding protein